MPAIHEVSLEAYAILGTASMPVSQLLRMGRGAVVELDTGLGDEIEVRIHDQLVATGEVVVVEDRIALEITENVTRETSQCRPADPGGGHGGSGTGDRANHGRG